MIMLTQYVVRAHTRAGDTTKTYSFQMPLQSTSMPYIASIAVYLALGKYRRVAVAVAAITGGRRAWYLPDGKLR